MNNTNSNSNTSCTLNNNSNIPSPVGAIPNVQSPNNSHMSQQKMPDSQQHQLDEQLQQQQIHSHQPPHQNSVFTIEQIELIRRLRKTNLTIDQFIEAYREMERLEAEMSMEKKDLLDSSASSITYALNSSTIPNNSQQLPSHHHLLQQPQHYQNSHQLNLNLNNHTIHSHYLQGHPQQSTNSIQPFSDDNIELINFKKKGEQAMMMEIRAFVSKYNIRQQTIAEMTRISQGYISTFFHGEKMSEKRKNIIYQWYLTYSKNPAKLATDRQQLCLNNNAHMAKFDSDYNGDGHLNNHGHHFGSNDVLFPITRRDRFIFRKQHLRILEQYFEENPYPEIHAKEQIVEECNLSAEKSSGKPLKEADKVTVAIVSNWFNNKRKNARSKHGKQFSSVNNSLNLSAGMGLNSHSLNSSGSANTLSTQPSNTNYIQNSPSPASSSAYNLGLQQPQSQNQPHQMQRNHQDSNFEQSYSYDCSYSNNTPPGANNSNTNSNNSSQVHIVRNPTSNLQFKTESYNNYMEGCFNKLQNPNSANSKSDNENDVDAITQDHDGSNISEYSSQTSFNGNDSIDN